MGFKSRSEHNIFHFTKTSKPGLKPTHPPIQKGIGFLSGSKTKFTMYLHLVSKLRIRTTTTLPPLYTPSWHEQQQHTTYIYIYIYIYDVLPYQIQHKWLHCFISYPHKTVNYTQFSNGHKFFFYIQRNYYHIKVAHSSKICYHKSVQISEGKRR